VPKSVAEASFQTPLAFLPLIGGGGGGGPEWCVIILGSLACRVTFGSVLPIATCCPPTASLFPCHLSNFPLSIHMAPPQLVVFSYPTMCPSHSQSPPPALHAPSSSVLFRPRGTPQLMSQLLFLLHHLHRVHAFNPHHTLIRISHRGPSQQSSKVTSKERPFG
jgi:hypothetical protein